MSTIKYDIKINVGDLTDSDDGPRYELHPTQKNFLIWIQNNVSQQDLTDNEQICLVHCLTYNHYSNIHKIALNNLIEKYTVKRNNLKV